MKLHGCISLILFAVNPGTFLTAQEPPSDAFVYSPTADGVPVPRYRDIESKLPDGILQSELLSVVDPEQRKKWQFGWFSYGESNSRSVAVGLRGETAAEFFVDVDRNKRFTEDELVVRDDNAPDRWLLPLNAEFHSEDNEPVHVERSVIIRRSSKTGFLEVATAGVMKGLLDTGDQQMLAVRIDRDANGRWFDADDRILLDTNADGKVDSIGGRISCDSICRLNGRRFVLQSDMQGERLDLVELQGAGKVIPRIIMQDSSATISEVTGVLVSKSGVRATIRSLQQAVDCPVGDYRVESISFEVTTADLNYWFRFSATTSGKLGITVQDGQTVEADLLGQLTLQSLQTTSSATGQTILQVTPTFTASTGLYLSGSRTGRTTPTLENRLLTQSVVGGKVIDNNSTGFS